MWHICGTNICGKICGIFVDQIFLEYYVEYFRNKYLQKNMWNICGTNIYGRLCGIFVEQIFMENVLNICGTNMCGKMCGMFVEDQNMWINSLYLPRFY